MGVAVHSFSEFKGQRQHGISTPVDLPVILIFTDVESKEYGYSDQFFDNGIFVYSGEGQQGDMAMEGGNERILNHKDRGDVLHVFEKVGDISGADVFSYDGQCEYVDHFWEQAPDVNGNLRRAVRFKLAPLGGIEADITEAEAASLSEDDLFRRAKQALSTKDTTETTTYGSSNEKSYFRSQLVRDFALSVANGVCQACEKNAPFRTNMGKPFLEVHHIHRRSDGGLDDPENIIAVCPNCHRETHYGEAGDGINSGLIQKAEDRNRRFS
ncbi:HNH endonuclease [Halococcus sediminicola]|uniref:HNH endonuclease n=1 Tax=Halococcus sediminicola TaxID=1264579 RepID=UPI00137863DA|nr:HNH endonuclease signature motif containing protein [Halococcus sediminicola]